MATPLYFRNTYPPLWNGASGFPVFSVKDAARAITLGADSLTGGVAIVELSTTAGTGGGTVTVSGTSIAGPTAGKLLGSTSNIFIGVTPPLSADVTISGTVTFALCGTESNMNANTTLRGALIRIDAQGAVTLIAESAAGGELGTGLTRITTTATPTSTACHKGDRLGACVLMDDYSAGTMGSGYTISLQSNGDAASVADSYVQITETPSFESSEPAGTTYYLRDDASQIGGKALMTAQGSATATAVHTTVAGALAFPGDQWTATAGGADIEWYTPPLAAFTLGGVVKVVLSTVNASTVLEAQSSPYDALTPELAIVDADGSNPVVWARGYTSVYGSNGDRHLSADDTAVGQGKRLRLRLFQDDMWPNTAVAGTARTMRYGGTSTYNSYLTFTQTITEAPSGVSASPGVGSLTLTGLAPTATKTDHRTVAPGVGALSVAGLAATVMVSDHKRATPGVAAIALAGLAAAVSIGVRVTPALGALTVAGLAPTVTVSDYRRPEPGVGALGITGYAPTITGTPPTLRVVTVKSTGGTYQTLSAAFAGEAANLVNLHRRLEIDCYNVADTTQANMGAGWTTDGACYVIVHAVDNHGGVWGGASGTSSYRLDVPGGAAALTVSVPFTVLRGLSVRSTGNGTITLGGANCRAERCIARFGGGDDGFLLNGTDDRVENCLAICDDPTHEPPGSAAFLITAQGGRLYNCTAVDGDYGFFVYSGVTGALVKNCLGSVTGRGSVHAFELFDGNCSWSTASTNCASNDTSSPAGQNHRTGQTFTFAGTGNYHLSASDAGARTYGADLTADGVTVDIDDQPIDDPWNIGADQFGPSNVTVTPEPGALTLSGTAPTAQVPRTVTPATGALTLGGLAPTALTPRLVTPGVGAATLTGLAPTVQLPRTVTPGVGAATLTGYAPTVTAAADKVASPEAGALALAGLAPTVSLSNNQRASPGLGQLALGGLAPTALTPRLVTPGVGALSLAGLAPTVSTTAHVTATPGVGALGATGLAPTVTATDHKTVTPGVGALALAGLAPSALTPHTSTPDTGTLALAAAAPTVRVEPRPAPGVGQLALGGQAPSAVVPKWAFVGVSASAATVTSGNVTPTEPSGVQAGDLLVACIAYRSNVAFGLPSGWATVATQQSSGDTDATQGIASGLMAWIVRGASAPDLTFTRTGGDQAIAAVVAYRGGKASPYHTGTANTLASLSATATTGTISTTESIELLVAMTSAGDYYNVSAFDAATNPATASGNTDTTTAPTIGAWIERHDTRYDLGADGGLGIADAVRGTAGATGTIQATEAGSGRHVMIAGAFKIGHPASTTPYTGGLVITGHAPTVVIPEGGYRATSTGALAVTGLAPTVTTTAHRTVTPGVGQLALGGQAPSALVGVRVTPAVGTLALTGLAPTVSASDHKTAAPSIGALSLAGLAPTVTAGNARVAYPGVGSLTLTGLAPIAGHSGRAVPGVGAVVLTGLAPTAGHSGRGAPGVGALTLTGYAPVVTGITSLTASPGTGQLSIAGFAPTVTGIAHQIARPGVGTLTLTGFHPTAQAPRLTQPGVAALALGGFAPTVTAWQHVRRTPGVGLVVLAGAAPTVTVSQNVWARPALGLLTLGGVAPLAIATTDVYGWRVEWEAWEGPRVDVAIMREGPRYTVILWDGPRWHVALDPDAAGVTMTDDLAPLDLPLSNDWTGVTLPITGINATTGLTELLHGGTVYARIVATSGSDTPIGALEVTCPELGTTGRRGVNFGADVVNAALGTLADGTEVYRVLSGPGFRIEQPLTVRKVRSG